VLPCSSLLIACPLAAEQGPRRAIENLPRIKRNNRVPATATSELLRGMRWVQRRSRYAVRILPRSVGSQLVGQHGAQRPDDAEGPDPVAHQAPFGRVRQSQGQPANHSGKPKKKQVFFGLHTETTIAGTRKRKQSNESSI